MGALVPFAFGDALVRVIEIGGDPWFVAGDVAKVLGYRDALTMTRTLDEDEADTHIMRIRSANGVMQDREVIIISESGLYHAIFKSRRPDAALFRKWVTSEVLPAIRRNGFYQMPRREVTSGWAASLDALRQREPTETEARMRDHKLGVLAFVEEQIEAGMGKSRAVAAAAQTFGRCSATIYSWLKEIKMVPREDVPVALTPVLVGGGRHADCAPEAWAELVERMKRPGVRTGAAVREVRALAAQNGWQVPHAKTLARRIEQHLDDPLVGDRTFRDLRQQMLAGPVNDGE